jgi:hypothetical protein
VIQVTLPNFLVIGANKAGTTALYHFLKAHPQIYMSQNKEPSFFIFVGAKELRKRPDAQILTRTVDNIEDYQALFHGVKNEKAIGEASTGYLPNGEAAARIRDYIPRAKLIALLRDPSDRAHSAHSMYVGLGLEPISDFASAVDRELAGCEWRHYVKLGFYYSQLKRYFELFDARQIKLFLYEDFQERPLAVLKEIFTFLEVDDSFEPDVSVRRNVSLIPKNRTLQSILTKDRAIKRLLKAVIPSAVRSRIKDNVMSWNGAPPTPLSPEVRHRLVQIYREDILKLQDLLQRDLGTWLLVKERLDAPGLGLSR